MRQNHTKDKEGFTRAPVPPKAGRCGVSLCIVPRETADSCRRSFTLVELLTVVIIISILASLAMLNQGDRKRLGEYKGALGQVRTIAGAEKNYFLAANPNSFISTFSTGNTNQVLGINIADGTFHNYRANSGGSSFSISVDYSGSGSGADTWYTFDQNGQRTWCGGAHCVN